MSWGTGRRRKGLLSIRDGTPIRCCPPQSDTPGSICLLRGRKMFTGDTLFVGGCGRVDLPGSDPEQMWQTMQKLRKMDDGIEIFPGHDYGDTPSSPLGHEKKHNPFLSSGTKEDFFGERL